MLCISCIESPQTQGPCEVTKPVTVLHLDDLRIARRILAGDETAFRQVFDDHYDRLYRFSLARVNGDQFAAEDLVQQSMSRAIQSLRSYRGESQLQTWLFTICRNTITDWKRKRGLDAQSVILAEDHPSIRAAVESFPAPDRDDPVVRTENLELSRRVQLALDQLPKHYGDALEWKYILGWTILEISEELKIGDEATQSLLARAKKAFAEIYRSLSDDSLSVAKSGSGR